MKAADASSRRPQEEAALRPGRRVWRVRECRSWSRAARTRSASCRTGPSPSELTSFLTSQVPGAADVSALYDALGRTGVRHA